MKTLIFVLIFFTTACRPESSKKGLLPEAAASTEVKPSHQEPREDDVPLVVESKPEAKTEREFSITDQYLTIMNEHRISKGLRPLINSPEIEQTALNHSRRMAQKYVPFGHMGSKLRCRSVLAALGLASGTLCGENVAAGQENAEEVFEAWINSPAHREAIEDSSYTHTGLGFYEDFRGKIYWTQIFVEIN